MTNISNKLNFDTIGTPQRTGVNSVYFTNNSASQITLISNKSIPDFDCFRTTNPQVNNLRSELAKIEEEQGLIGKAWNGIKSIFGGGSKKVEKNIEKFKKGEISFEEAQESIKKYKAGQDMSVDVVGDMLSGIIAVASFALAVPTGGGSIAAGLAIATAVGAGSKIAIKAGDSAVGGREYNLKDLGYDAATGAINGLLSPVTNGIGASVTKTIGTKLGLTVVKEGTEEVIEQGFKQGIKSVITQQGVDVIGGSLKNRVLATGLGMAADGAIGGAADNMVRASFEGKDVIKAGIQGAAGGLIMAPLIGGGFKIAGKAGRALNNKIVTKSVMPDGLNTKFKQGSANDCAFLSILNGIMSDKEAQKKVKNAITSPLGSDFYNVKIGNKSVNVAKSVVTDNLNDELSSEKAIRIFEIAYKQLKGTDDALDGGFAEIVAKQFGLNPVHITKELITDELLDRLSKEQNGTVLSIGAFVNQDGTIVNGGVNKHYFTIKNIDAKNKIVTVTDPYDTAKLIDLPYEKIKTDIISIDGGSIKETNLPNVVRNIDEKLFNGINISEATAKLEKLLTEQGTGIKEVNEVLSQIKCINGSSYSVEDIAVMMKQYNISSQEISDFIISRIGSDSLGEWIELGEGAEIFVDLIKSMERHTLIQNNSLLDSFKLSLQESSEIYSLIQISDTNKVCELLMKKNPDLFEQLGGSKYIENNLHKLQQSFSNTAMSMGKYISPENVISLPVKINGQEKSFVFPNAPSTVSHVGIDINYKTLLESNMITTDVLDIMHSNGISLPSQITCKVKGASKDSFKYVFDTDTVLKKIKENGFSSLSSREIHALTDALCDLYDNNSILAKKISSNKALKNKGAIIYDYVNILKQRAQSSLEKTNVQIDDHAYMRMIDRDIASVVDNKTGQIIEYPKYIEMLIEQARTAVEKNKLKDVVLEGVEGANGIKMIIRKTDNGKILIESVMS